MFKGNICRKRERAIERGWREKNEREREKEREREGDRTNGVSPPTSVGTIIVYTGEPADAALPVMPRHT
jgi:hypothetical protein